MTEVIDSPAALTAALEAERAGARRVGLVPTMGALHAGHLALIASALEENDTVVCSIFVNPLQFGSASDLERYPRDLEADLSVLDTAGVARCFAPSVAAMYPRTPDVTVDPGLLGGVLEGASRPGHFAGVATVCTKLFSIVGPARAYFGEKDYQQLTVIRRLVTDLSIPVEIRAVPTVRDPDGLALSSRNARLTADGRTRALALHRALEAGRALVEHGEAKPTEVDDQMAGVLDSPGVEADYAVVRSLELETLSDLEGEVRLLVAGVVEGVRLIDNCGARR